MTRHESQHHVVVVGGGGSEEQREEEEGGEEEEPVCVTDVTCDSCVCGSTGGRIPLCRCGDLNIVLASRGGAAW